MTLTEEQKHLLERLRRQEPGVFLLLKDLREQERNALEQGGQEVTRGRCTMLSDLMRYFEQPTRHMPTR